MEAGEQQGCGFSEGLPPFPDELQRGRKALMPKNGRKERHFSQRRKSQRFSMFPLDKSRPTTGFSYRRVPLDHTPGRLLAWGQHPWVLWAHAETSDWRVPR